jgi:hypothetical protein
MDSMLRSGLVIMLVGTALVVAACGSDDGSAGSTPTGAGPTGTTGATGGAGAAIPVPPVAGESGTGGTRGGPSSKGGTGTSGQRHTKTGNDRSTGGGNRRRGSRRGTTITPSGGGSPPTQTGQAPRVSTDAAAFKLAKEICANVTLEGIALNLRISLEERDASFVARAYSRSYPAGHRDAAYKGCLEGFRNPVKP